MSLVTWPCRKVLASAPVRASLPRPERSTTKVTDARLVTAIVEPGDPALDLALQLVHHALARDPRRQRRADDGDLLGAVQALEQGEQPFHVERDLHVYALRRNHAACRDLQRDPRRASVRLDGRRARPARAGGSLYRRRVAARDDQRPAVLQPRLALPPRRGAPV